MLGLSDLTATAKQEMSDDPKATLEKSQIHEKRWATVAKSKRLGGAIRAWSIIICGPPEEENRSQKENEEALNEVLGIADQPRRHGPCITPNGVVFNLWAPTAQSVELLERGQCRDPCRRTQTVGIKRLVRPHMSAHATNFVSMAT